MVKRKVEIMVGLFVAAGLAALVMLAMMVSNLSMITGDDGYEITARFENIGGLKVRSPVNMAGVRVGKVTNIRLDQETFEAVVVMKISAAFNRFPKDTSASVFTSGLLGEQYIALDAGGEETVLQQGDVIQLTQSSLVLEQILGQFLFSKAAGDE